MMISTKGRYALRVMIELASHDPEKFIPLKQIAAEQNISEKYLEAIVKLLVKDGMIIGLRGKGGGYKLAKAPSSYSVGSILRLTEGSLAPVSCLECQPVSCPRAETCTTLPMWRELDSLINNYLDSLSLEDLIGQSQGCPGDDYII